jgi:hypothetical protein
MTTTARGTLVSLADIARLARVQRPVVSMWRKRPTARGVIIPFPQPRATRDAHDVFDLAEVLDWLEQTGRGKNVEARVEAPLVLSHVTRDGDSAESAALEALLVLGAMSDRPLTDMAAHEILDLADELDPDDDFAFTELELEAVSDELPRLAARAAALSEAAFGPAGALAALAPRDAGLDTQAAHVVADVVASILNGEAMQAIALTGPASSVEIAGEILDQLPEGTPYDVLIPDSQDREATRRVRRAVVARGLSVSRTTSRPVVAMADVGSATTTSTAAVLSAAEEVQLDLRPDDAAVAIGPASALVDAQGDPRLDLVRSDVLRSGRLRCIVRLPKGLVPASPRAALALWVFGPDRGLPPIADRWVATFDLSDRALSPDVTAALVSDIAATLAEPRLGAVHAFALGRLERVPDLLARRGALVARGATPRRLATIGAESVVNARRLAESLTTNSADAVVSPTAIVTRRPAAPLVTLAELIDAGAVALIPGARVSPQALGAGSVPLLRVDDLSAAPGEAARAQVFVDPLDLELRAPRARRTEPGDVVFCTAPRPVAAVDRDGRAVVCAPARVLRPTPDSGISPEALAAAVNSQSATAREWRSWRVVRFDVSEAASLSSALRAVEDERTRLWHRLATLDQLTSHLTTGAATVAADPTSDQHPTEGP